MPWFKVDDTFPHHAKVLAAGNAAIGLWARAGAWSMQQLTDGHVPQHVARTLGTAAEAKRLVSSGLWVEVDDGYSFHNWDERQPSKAKVEQDRHDAAERQRKAREAAKARRDAAQSSGGVTPMSQRDSQSDTPVSHGPPDPTRPDPTRPVLPTEVLPAPSEQGADPSATPPKGKPKNGTQFPADFQPNDTNRRLADERDLDVDELVEAFRDFHRSKGSTFKDWHLALNTWIRREKPTPRRRPEVPAYLPHAADIEQPPPNLTPAEYDAWDAEQRERRRRSA